MSRGTGAAAVVCLILGACSSPRGDAAPDATPIVAEPAGDASPTPPAGALSSVERAASAAFVIRLVDHNGAHPSGIPVEIDGPERGSRTSDARGQVVLDRPGQYEIRVLVGCHERLIVSSGGSGRAGVAAGQRFETDLAVEWQHRYGPSGPVFANFTGGWPVGQVTELRYNVVDRCTRERAPGAGYPTFEFVPGPNLAVEGTPGLVADGEGYGRLAVRCLAAGDTSLVVRDTRNESDTLDVVEATFDVTRPKCVEG